MARLLKAYLIHGNDSWDDDYRYYNDYSYYSEKNDINKKTTVEIKVYDKFAHIMTPYNCEYNCDYIMDRLTATEYEPEDMFVHDETFTAVFVFNRNGTDSEIFKQQIIKKAGIISKWNSVRNKILKNQTTDMGCIAPLLCFAGW